MLLLLTKYFKIKTQKLIRFYSDHANHLGVMMISD